MWLVHAFGELCRAEDVGRCDELIATKQNITRNIARRQERQATDLTYGIEFHHEAQLGADAVVVENHATVEVQLMIVVLKQQKLVDLFTFFLVQFCSPLLLRAEVDVKC